MLRTRKRYAREEIVMRRRRGIVSCIAVVVLAIAVVGLADETAGPDHAPTGPFGNSLIKTQTGSLLDLAGFMSSEGCAVCHQRQFKEFQGSMHSAAHSDPLYRNLAEMARREAGPATYTFCSACHSSAGVVSGFIPAKHEADLPRGAKAGVSCDVCHQISSLTGADGPWGEPGNASFVLRRELTGDGPVKFGHSGQVAANRVHTGEKRAFFTKSEFCASCHTVIHPVSGLRIEHTYGEWKSSVYAERGIQCQDCHMRSVRDAIKVAETLRPVSVKGQSVKHGPVREIFPHFFVGGNANAARLADGAAHARMAKDRLKSAARLELFAPDRAEPSENVTLEIRVHNVAAGHDIPTGVTELRQMWVGLRILDHGGNVRYREDGLDQHGRIRSGVVRFGAIAGNEAGEETFKLWETTQFLWKRTIGPKSFQRDEVVVKLPPGLSGEATIEARLYYRSVAPDVARQIMQEESFEAKIVEMSRAQATVSIK